MNDLLLAIKVRCGELLAGVEYPDPTGGSVTPAIRIGALPPKRSDPDQGQDFPFVVIRPAEGDDQRSESRCLVRLVCGSWAADDDVEAGLFRALDLATRLRAIQRSRGFPPWRLELPVKWRSGQGEENAQPHPYYLITIELSFKAPPLADIEQPA